MSERDFQLEVMQALGELKTDVAAIKEHFAALNGKDFAQERELSERRGAEKANTSWLGQIAPIARYVAGVLIAAVVLMAISHPEVLKLK